MPLSLSNSLSFIYSPVRASSLSARVLIGQARNIFLRSSVRGRGMLSGLTCWVVSSEEASFLTSRVSDDEIFNAVKSPTFGKAPGVDGFGASLTIRDFNPRLPGKVRDLRNYKYLTGFIKIKGTEKAFAE